MVSGWCLYLCIFSLFHIETNFDASPGLPFDKMTVIFFQDQPSIVGLVYY